VVVGGSGGGEGEEDNKLPLYSYHPPNQPPTHPKPAPPNSTSPQPKNPHNHFPPDPLDASFPKALHRKLLHTGDLGRRRWGQSFSVERKMG